MHETVLRSQYLLRDLIRVDLALEMITRDHDKIYKKISFDDLS